MGRRPLPTAVKMARGNPSKVPLCDNEPKPEVSSFTFPDWFSYSEFTDDMVMEEAQRQWDKAAEESIDKGVVTILDEPILALWCVTYARFIVVCRRIAIHAKDPDSPLLGGATVSILARERNNSGRDLKGLSAELGFTPSSRSKVSAAGKRKAGPDWSQFDEN